LLIDEGLATEIESCDEHCMGLFSLLSIKITLTEEGLERFEDVCGHVF
jgi:hypothetical protein